MKGYRLDDFTSLDDLRLQDEGQRSMTAMFPSS